VLRRCGWGATSENRLKIGVLQGGGSLSAKFLRKRGCPPPIVYTRIDRRMRMPYNFVAEGFHTRKLWSRLSSREVRFCTKKAVLRFWTPSSWELRGNAWCSSWAHWKARSGLLISVNWTFLLSVMAEALRANIDWKSAISLQRGPFDPTFRRDSPITNLSSPRKTSVLWWY